MLVLPQHHHPCPSKPWSAVHGHACVHRCAHAWRRMRPCRLTREELNRTFKSDLKQAFVCQKCCKSAAEAKLFACSKCRLVHYCSK